ncbi:DUF5990 family protein [uncultured Paludibaculum sp.]|uniref:DUF5990 family protein n=1 Tax=uncultured Paludibaculum sp. TaxID=1765020 RepID=UPI002AAB02B7|nr:DUF5990 family protein [uncultured Paludibaculum sp.]
METTVRLRITLINPPAGVDFGVQKGRGGTYETIGKVRSNGGILTFDITVGLKPGPTAAAVDFSGPLVQGPPGGRFLYLDIGTYAGQPESCWSRRLKIPLTGITQVALERLAANPETVLETRIAGTARDGGPTCGTVKPFHGWIPIAG